MLVVGMPLLILPGVYLRVRYSLLGFCMADAEADLRLSFRQSVVIGVSPLGLGLLVTAPAPLVLPTGAKHLRQRDYARIWMSVQKWESGFDYLASFGRRASQKSAGWRFLPRKETREVRGRVGRNLLIEITHD